MEYAVYLLLAMLLQGLLFSRLSILGVKGFVLPAAVVAAGMYLGGVRGAVFGICLGLVTDMSYTESSFMYTIVFALIGFGAGFASELYKQEFSRVHGHERYRRAAVRTCAVSCRRHLRRGGARSGHRHCAFADGTVHTADGTFVFTV